MVGILAIDGLKSKKETYNYIRQGNFLNPRDYSTAREEKTVLNIKYRIAFIYSEFGCIVDDLITRYGKEKFMQYVKRLNSAFNHEKIFKEIYGIDLDAYLFDFKKRVTESVQKT